MQRKFLVVSVIVLITLLTGTVASAQNNIPGTGWWSGEQVQNVSAADAQVVVTAYAQTSGDTFTTGNQTVPAGGAVTFIPSSFTNMPDGFQGSAVVSADQPIKAIVNVTNQKAGAFGVDGGKAAAQYQGTENVSTTIYFPLAKHNRFGKTTVFYIQNAGNAAATANYTFNMDNGGQFTGATASIGPNQMVILAPADANVPSTNDARANIGSLVVTSAQPLAGTVMEFDQNEAIGTVLKGTRAFTQSDFDVKAYAPVAKHNRFGRFTGIQVQNVSSAAIDVTITYVGSSRNTPCFGQTYTDTHAGIEAGKSFTFVQLGAQTQLLDNCTASATIEGTGNFVAIVNEENMTGAPAAGITYSAMPASQATTKVSVPLFKDQRFGFTTGLQIQNVGTAEATNVVATFTCKGGNSANTPFVAISNPQTIAPGGAKLFYKPSTTASDFTAANPFAMNGANCGVVVTGDQPLVAIANEAPDTAGALDDNNYEGFNLTP